MKLTPKQNELIEEYKHLESKYGKGNVFLRYVNDFWRIQFIIHKIGEKKYSPIYDYKINGRVINSLDRNNLLIGYDNKHKEADPNSWRSQPKNWFLLVQELEQNVSSNETRVSLDDWRKIRWNRLKAKNCREQQLLD